MRALLFTLLLALLPTAAGAQVLWNVCGVPDPKEVKPYRDFNPETGATCASPTTPTIRWNAFGMMAWRYCRDGAVYRPQWVAGTWAHISSTALGGDLLSAGMTPSDATIVGLAAKHIKTPLADPALLPVWCPHVVEMYAGVPIVPVAPAWVTASTVAYILTRGALTSGGTTTAGRACDCAKPFKLGAATYCTFTGAPTPAHVTRCKAGS